MTLRLKLIMSLLLWMTATDYVFGQDPEWSVDYSQFTFRMSVVAMVEHNGELLGDGENKVAAFVGDEIRGLGYLDSYHEPTDRYLAVFQVGSSVTSGEEITLYFYSESENTVVESRFTVDFVSDELLGTINEPYLISDNSYPKTLSVTASSYPENLESDSLIAAIAIVDADDDVHTFTLTGFDPVSASSLIKVDGTNLVAAEESNFEELDQFSVTLTAEDALGASIATVLTFTITDQPEAPTDISLSENKVVEDSSPSFVLGILSTQDDDENETQTYSFSRNDQNSDSVHFDIDGDALWVVSRLNYLDHGDLTLYITLEDKDGLTYEEEVTVVITDENGDPVDADLSSRALRIRNYISPNGDGINDFLTIENSEIYNGFTLTIMNSRGNILYSEQDYNNDWDGRHRGSVLPTGVYFYIFESPELNIRYQGKFYIKDR